MIRLLSLTKIAEEREALSVGAFMYLQNSEVAATSPYLHTVTRGSEAGSDGHR